MAGPDFPAAAAPPPDGEGIFNVVLGTAGHIDHGKSALVAALTGIHPDRLKEEQERGITIDLGFAPLRLQSGLRVGIVDVPGHERFVKNMVAGATGIDFVLFVVAADDGVMAQTREHLQILRLLGVPDGLTVITKTDLVEAGFVELVREEVRELARGSCLEDKPILPVSSKTGAGLPELRAALERALAGLRRRTDAGPFRMPIQRVFAKEGFGTVVTGIPVSGAIAAGEPVVILPPGHAGRVKYLQAYQHPIARARAGHSTALNVAGIERHTVVRGMVAATPGVFAPTRLVSAHLLHLHDAPFPLKHRAPVRFHAGTAEIMGKVLLLEGDRLAPGAEGFVQLLLEEPAVLCPGDRFILRHQSPMVTCGGGQVLDNVAPKRKRSDPQVLADLAARRACLGRPGELLACILAAAPGPETRAELCAELGMLPSEAAALAAGLAQQGKLAVLKAGESWLGHAAFERLTAQVRACADEFFREHPAVDALERPELRRRLELALHAHEPLPWMDDLLLLLERSGVLRSAANLVRFTGRERRLDDRAAAQARQIEEQFRAGGLAPPEPAQVQAALKLPPKVFQELLRFLVDTGCLVTGAPGVFFHRSAHAAAAEKIRALFQRMPEITVSEIRKELGMNRKFVVPLVEYFDREGLTVRVGDVRRLKAAGKTSEHKGDTP